MVVWLSKKTIFGNLYKRDWGHARDYVEAMWKMLQQRTKWLRHWNWQSFTIKDFVNEYKDWFKIKWAMVALI